jgi:NIPSNAP protein
LTAVATLPRFGPAANPTDKEITVMLYELRTYYAMPGRLPDISRRFADITMGYFKQYDIHVVGFWTNELGGSSEQLIYMLGWESLADREKKWSAFAADKERLAKFAETEKNGPLISRLTAQILKPTSYSPMK